MKIGFEAKRFFRNFTGLGNYSRFVVNALSTFAPDNSYFLYTPRASQHQDVLSITSRENVHVILPPPIYKDLKLTSLWRSWTMSGEPSIKDLDIFHGLSHERPIGLPKKIKKVVTVHDLIFIRYPQLYNVIDAAIYKAKLVAACRAADKIIAISRQTADDLIKFLQVDPSKIEVVYQGVHPIFTHKLTEEQIQAVKKKYDLPSEYILNVGTIEERKNVLSLVKAVHSLPESQRIPLVIVGRPTPYLSKVKAFIKEHNIGHLIIFLHGTPFQDLPAFYQGAKLFVYPSLFEGFGIPVVEAIQSGVPVITSKGSCFLEAGGPNSIYVEPLNHEGLLQSIKDVLNQESTREKMITIASEYIQKFSPQVIAADLLKIYETL